MKTIIASITAIFALAFLSGAVAKKPDIDLLCMLFPDLCHVDNEPPAPPVPLP